MIPKIIHFIYGLDEHSSDIPFSYFHYVSIRSAKVINPDCEVVMHYQFEPPNNEWWEKSKNYMKMDRLSSTPEFIHGKKVKYHAHKADLLRVEILLAEGGIYLDADTLCVKPFEPLMVNPFTMGMEIYEGQITGLCNAVIISEKDHEFLRLWKEEFVHFRPDHWNFMACLKPLELFLSHQHLVYLEPPESFFRLTWSEKDLQSAHVDVVPYTRSYSMHLWQSGNFQKYLQKIRKSVV